MQLGDTLAQIDWHAPWLASLLEVAEPVRAAGKRWRDAFNQAADVNALCNAAGLPLQFVEHSELPADVDYEAYIGRTGRIPTRDNLHDFFNGLMWLAYPRIKARLNALQAADIATRVSALGGVAQSERRRSGLRDALTLFDENVALVVSQDQDLITALQSHDWQQLFVARRERFVTQVEVLMFGHALLEKLARPYKAITAHAWIVPLAAGDSKRPSSVRRALIDAHVAGQLDVQLRTTGFCHLPVLGVPGWSAAQSQGFYADCAVFRPLRNRRDYQVP